jgi:hypothetical protein
MSMNRFSLVGVTLLTASLVACGNGGGGGDASAPKPAPPTKAPEAAANHTHDGDADMKKTDGAEHADGHEHGDDHHHGPTVELGEQSVGGFSVRASRDGEVTPGGDVPIDAWITGGAKVSAVRFWIGTEDAKGSMKAKAELEKENWHVHVDVPSPMPEGSKLWIEIQSEGGDRTTVGFDLKASA